MNHMIPLHWSLYFGEPQDSAINMILLVLINSVTYMLLLPLSLLLLQETASAIMTPAVDSLEAWSRVSLLRVAIDLASSSAEKHGHSLATPLQDFEDDILELDSQIKDAARKKRPNKMSFPKQVLSPSLFGPAFVDPSESCLVLLWRVYLSHRGVSGQSQIMR